MKFLFIQILGGGCMDSVLLLTKTCTHIQTQSSVLKGITEAWISTEGIPVYKHYGANLALETFLIPEHPGTIEGWPYKNLQFKHVHFWGSKSTFHLHVQNQLLQQQQHLHGEKKGAKPLYQSQCQYRALSCHIHFVGKYSYLFYKYLQASFYLGIPIRKSTYLKECPLISCYV